MDVVDVFEYSLPLLEEVVELFLVAVVLGFSVSAFLGYKTWFPVSSISQIILFMK
jgi:hypothetical protein